MALRLLVVSVAVAVVAGCGGGAAGGGVASSSGPAGATVARARGCVACHSIGGGASVGPTWKGLAGSDVVLDDGTVVRADSTYLTESIADPSAKRVRGFAVTMPRLSLTDAEIAALVTYIETLR